MQLSLDQPKDLQGGVIYQDEVKNWIDMIFQKDVSTGIVTVHENLLQFPDGLLSSPEEARARAEVYNIQALLNSYRIRQLCTLDTMVGESLLHAHADLFLSKGYAAWNLSGKSRVSFENSLKSLTDPTLTMLFTGNAPVCSVADNEVIDSFELKKELLDLKRENANFKSISEQAADEMTELQEKLQKKEEQIKLMEENISDSIQAGLFAKEKELEELRENIDLIVAAALQEQKDTRIESSSQYPARIASLQAHIQTLEKENVQLEYYLRVARDALVDKKHEKLIIEGNIDARPRRRAATEVYDVSDGSDSEAFSTNVPVSSMTMEDMAPTKKKRPEKGGCALM